MPIIKSAKKRVKTARKATIRNVKTKRSLKTALKSFASAATGKKSEAATKAQSEIDKAVKKGVMNKNKAARKKSQLAKAAKKSGAKITTAKKTTKAAKTPAKKPATKKPAAKKATAKKTSAKS